MSPSEANPVHSSAAGSGDVLPRVKVAAGSAAPVAPATKRVSGERVASIATYREEAVADRVVVPTDGRYTRRAEFLPFSPPVIGEEEVTEVVDTLRSDWLTTGPKTRCFEQEFAHYVGAHGALALNSCTAGLHTALVHLR